MSTELLGRTELLKRLERAGVRPSKSLGQNFVMDPNTIASVVRRSGVSPGDDVLEIGAGLGSLTLGLVAAGARVVAVEIDKRLVDVLNATMPSQVEIVAGDALEIDLNALLADRSDSSTQRWAIVANLPYNIATPLVLSVLEGVPAVDKMLVMVQREVGERLSAGVGDEQYGAVSVRVAYFAEASVVGRVAPEVFLPRPNVESVLVRITRRQAPAVDPSIVGYSVLSALIRRAFTGRRKMLRRSLSGVVSPVAYERSGIASSARPEELDVQDWGKLAACQLSIVSSPPPS